MLIYYHIGEEILIAAICFAISLTSYKYACQDKGQRSSSRCMLFAGGFVILGLSGLIHAFIHAFHFDTNLLYQTLLGYCFGLLIIITSLSAEKVDNKKYLPLGYLPLLLLLIPGINQSLPLFAEFRPLVWISVSYLSGVVCMLFFAVFYRKKEKKILFAVGGFFLICASSALLFFPAEIGSPVWFAGHILRPVGFALLFAGIYTYRLSDLDGSILYKALTAFSMLAAIPLLIFGTVIFYENISPINFLGERLLLFLLLLSTLSSALLFSLGMILRLVKPILYLKDTVERLVDEGLHKRLTISSNDEIGELSASFNQMITRLGRAIDEQERMCRLAATGELAATLAHEIKNPLNAIGGAAAYIGKNYEGTLIQEFIKIITDEVKRINHLTLTLLNFAKPIQPVFKPTDINKLVSETLFLLKKEAHEHNIEIAVKLAETPPMASCDPHQIKQILINLLINAFDAVDQNGRVIVKTLQEVDLIRIEVKDNGQGIPPEIAREIFNPFFTTKTRGTGLGLAISKKIAREHGGDLIFESAPGAGSTFTLLL